jgi:hypothetical protein
VPALAGSYVGGVFGNAMTALLCLSLLTLMLATHNAAMRALPRAAVRGRTSLVLSGITAVVVIIGAVAGLDPYLTMAAWLISASARSAPCCRPPSPASSPSAATAVARDPPRGQVSQE